MRRSQLLWISGLTLTLAACGTSVEDAKAECEKLEWEAEQFGCYQQLAVTECRDSLCDLITSDTAKNACVRAVERGCK